MQSFGSQVHIMTILAWITLVFYLVSRPPGAPIPFPDQSDRAARASYNPDLALALDESLRDFWQKPDQVLNSLGDLSGLYVADIGCGEGYFTQRLLRLVGPQGRVFATDIRQDVLNTLEASIPEDLRQRAQLILSDGVDSGIQDVVDVILLVQVLGEVEEPGPFLESLKKIMTDQTRLVIIDSKHITDANSGFTRPLNLSKLLRSLEEHNLTLQPDYTTADFNFLPKQFFFVLQKTSEPK